MVRCPNASPEVNMNAPNHPSESRQNFLTIFLTLVVGLFFLFVLVLITGGFFFYIILALLGITGLGAFHYVLWGKALTDEVAGLREEEQLRQRAEAEDLPVPERRVFRR
jgi:hypothetical protein